MKILLISSSPHKEKSSTFLLAQEVLKGLQREDCRIDIVHLADCTMEFCRHCEACHKNILNCPINDDVAPILEKMLEADGIIFASPNYISQVTGSMKTLFDRSAHCIHCKRFLGKYVAGVVSSGSGRNKEVLDYISFYAHTCGAQYTGGVSSIRLLEPAARNEAVKLGEMLAVDIKEKNQYPNQLEIIERSRQQFKEVIAMRKNDWEEEYQFWVDKGWL